MFIFQEARVQIFDFCYIVDHPVWMGEFFLLHFFSLQTILILYICKMLFITLYNIEDSVN